LVTFDKVSFAGISGLLNNMSSETSKSKSARGSSLLKPTPKSGHYCLLIKHAGGPKMELADFSCSSLFFSFLFISNQSIGTMTSTLLIKEAKMSVF
jgi:hypothetical protein